MWVAFEVMDENRSSAFLTLAWKAIKWTTSFQTLLTFSVECWLLNMAHHTVQLFKSLREFFKVVGLHPSQLRHGSFNFRNVIGLVSMTLSMMSSCAFFIYGAANIRDYYASFYTFITELIHVGCFPSFRSNMMNIFVLMDEFEAFVEKSESNLGMKNHFCPLQMRILKYENKAKTEN